MTFEEIAAQSAQMKSMFVNWELAKRLKAIGFNEPCFAYFWAIKDTFHYTVKYHDHNTLVSRVSAPLLQQVIDWLDKKTVFIDIDHEFGEDWTYRINKWKFYVDNGGNGHSGDDSRCYENRSLATLAAIDEALVIIENNTIRTTNYRGV